MMIRRFLLVCFLTLAGPVGATNVIVTTPLGNFTIELFDETAPNTVANFLNYVRDNDYEGSFFHRSVPGFVIQGGGFTFANATAFNIPTDPPIANEFGASNTRGTVAMARVGGNPDSATSQWFVNLDDNSDQLDSVDGGFTVFGRVDAAGMEVVDAIAALPVWNFGGVLAEVPLIDYPGSGQVQDANIVFTDVEVEGEDGFRINAGMSGAWFNAATAGQGFLFDIIDTPDTKQVFAAWFTYDQATTAKGMGVFGATEQRWFTAGGDFDGATAQLTISSSSGGIFNDPATTTLTSVGTMTLEFFDCITGQVTFAFTDPEMISDTIDIQRLSPDAFCADQIAR